MVGASAAGLLEAHRVFAAGRETKAHSHRAATPLDSAFGLLQRIGDRPVSDLEARMKALMLRGLAGDAAAHSELLREISGYLRVFFARRLGRDAADLEDLVQETLLAIHTRRDTFDRGQPFTNWAYTIARYKLIDLFRRKKIRRTEPLEAADTLFAASDAEEGAVRLDLDRLMSTLPERQRALLHDVKVLGLSNAEAAAKTGMTEGAVKISIHRSLKALARRVSDAN